MIHTSRYPAPVLPDEPLTSYVFEHASKWPERVALRDGITGEATTYAELADLVDATASALDAAGLASGDVVALVAPNQPWWVVALHGAVRAGGVVTPVNPAFTVEEITRLLEHCHARMVIADAGVEDKVRAAAKAVGARVLLIGTSAGPDALPRLAATAARRPLAARRGGDLAVLPFSSGTTGLPKGVALTHRNLVATLAQHEGLYDVTEGDVMLAALPMFHIYGLSIIVNYGLRHGATVVTLPRFDADRFFALVASEGVTWLHLAPPMVLLLAGTDPGAHDLRSVRHSISGGAPLDPGVQARAERVLGCAIGQGYGMTETSPGITFVPHDRPPGAHGSVGVLVGGTEARLVDPATGLDAAVGESGELWVRGEQVMSGYLDNPAATSATVVDGGWLRTGDIATVDTDGYWWVVDRLKELIKYKGWQVAPAELESVLLGHPQVSDAAVVGRPDPDAGEIPVGFVVVSDPDADPEEVMAWVAARVAPYKKIRRLHLIDAIPRSPSGKILRRELRRPEAGGSAVLSAGASGHRGGDR